jgi:hypothetical protein
MQKLFIISLILSTNILAQNKHIEYEPVTWYELQMHELDGLKAAAELNLAQSCPPTLEKLQNTYSITATQFQYLFGTNYIWSVFTNDGGLKCLVKHDKTDSINRSINQTINPVSYELLNTTQSRILLNASLGIIDKEKEDAKEAKIAEEISKYEKSSTQAYEKYGGLGNILLFMRDNSPAYEIDKNIRANSAFEYFELRYSQKQKDELIMNVKKRKITKQYNNL